MSDQILVTGGTGFIGQYLVRKLIAGGHRPVVTCRSDPPPESGANFICLDITDSENLEDIFRTVRPEAVVHLAGVTGRDDRDGTLCNKVNFLAAKHVLSVCTDIGVKRIVMLGSAAEYGHQPTPFRENMPVCPVSAYGISKANATAFAMEAHSQVGLPVTVLRVFSAYGPGQPSKMFLPQLVAHAIQNRRFEMSDGLRRRDFVHVRDVANAIVEALDTDAAIGRVINVGGGRGVELGSLAREVWERCRVDRGLLSINALSSSGDDRFDTEANISLAAELLSWTPGPGILELDENLDEMISGLRSELRAHKTTI